MSIAHFVASGMGGMRAAGDLVARMEFSKRMKIGEAKDYEIGRASCRERV